MNYNALASELAAKYNVTPDVVLNVINALLPVFGKYGFLVKTFAEVILKGKASAAMAPARAPHPAKGDERDAHLVNSLLAQRDLLCELLAENCSCLDAILGE